MRFPFILVLCVAPLLLGCARDENADLRARLSTWFALDRTVYFSSKMRCTAAIYKVEQAEPKPSLSVQRDPENAKRVFRMERFAAIQMDDFSPSDLADSMLLAGDGIFGKQVLAAAAQSVPCVEGTPAEGDLRRALTRKGALLAYDPVTEGVVVLDPIAAQLFYVAGDVW